MQPTSELGGSALRARTFGSMGTVISLTVPAGAVPETVGGEGGLDAASAAVERVFAGLDETFSLYLPDSEASRLARGELSLRDSSAAMRDRFAEALGWRLRTEGAFSPERPDGVLDLSGLIKGYAIGQAGEALRSRGITDWCLNAGGDVLVMGSPVPGSGTAWAAGVVDPLDRSALLAAYELGGPGPRCALATSGSAERGEHIWAAGAGSRTAGFLRRRVRPGLRGRSRHCHRRCARDGDRGRRDRDAAPGHGRLGDRCPRRPPQRGTARDAGVPRLGCRSRDG
ncbi:hypothetical protein NicSoilC12_22110 [Arthrobacter sp. NicSoilC12]|nr:hypothetical protein NicSoilC12_22110 [Arthrobacter sp. NicSoilC12]